MRVSVVRGLTAIAALSLLIGLPGCGGGSSTTNAVTSINLTPTSISLNEGAVSQLSAIALSASGTTVPADITFTSSNAKIATVSSGGLICGGVWDASIINCNAVQGTAGVGQVTITATATAFNITATTTVYVHERVDQVQAIVPSDCTTMGKAISISGKAFSTSAPGCSPAAPCDITSTVGPFGFGSNNTVVAATSAGIQSTYSSTTNTPVYLSGGTITGSQGQTCNLSSFNGVIGATATVKLTSKNTIASSTQLSITSAGYGATSPPTTATLSNGSATCSGTASVQTALTSGVMTAQTPGMTSLFAGVSGVNSVGIPYTTCRVNSILVHSSSGSGTSFSLTPPNTQGLTADVLDSAGQPITPTLNWASSSNAAATVAATGTSNGATVTAVTGGTASITASCASPKCNVSLPTQYSQNVATVAVPQADVTTVYVASSNSKMLVPVSTADNSVGASITLPYYPNSIVADPAGKGIYLGSAAGIMAVATGSTAVGTYAVSGTILAISPDGNYLLISDNVHNVIQYFSIANGALANSKNGFTANSSAYTPDSLINEWVGLPSSPPMSSTQLGVGFSIGFLNSFDLPSPGFLDISGPGGLTYISSTATAQVLVYSTCNTQQNQAVVATSPTLIKALPKGTGAVAIDPPSIDVISTPATLGPGCPVPVTTPSTINGYDLGLGSFTPVQLLVTSNSSFAWVLSDLPTIVGFNLSTLSPSTVALAGGATPANGSLTLDGLQLWVGASDNKVHRIDTQSPTDVIQVSVNLKDANGNTTAPNLISVVP
ncbi:MAG TPA: Ig-like domain-containing protein [Terriglobales bacterium]